MNITENEVDSVHITGFPTIKFYHGNKKHKASIDYSGERTTDAIIHFLKANAFNELALYEEKKEEKTDDL